MVVAIAVVTAFAYWDEERESRAALDDFATEQATLALSLSAGSGDGSLALAGARAIERPGAVRVLSARRSGVGLEATDGSVVRSAPLEDAAASDATSVRLSREQAAALGLPARTALAGLAPARGAHGSTVIVVATAQAERDREIRAQWRLVLGVLIAAGLVVAFGGVAMRTERKEIELGQKLALARADKLATMGALATGIAHEVSTPLGVILGRAEQLLPKQTDDRARRAVETIVEQSERINTVIRGFLSLARGQAPTLEHADPARLARAAVELVTHRFETAAVRLASDVGADLPRVRCDPRLFEQVLVNLLVNACDACDEGGLVTLTVRSQGGADQVSFVVTDDGMGIDPAAAARATEPFFTTKPEGKGTGLGLAIANEIVKHHRGSLALRPRKDGRGTRASVELPAATTSDHA
jgi:signal transduction histidine kinase